MDQDTQVLTDDLTVKTGRNKSKKLISYLRQFLAIVFWLYVFVKLFIFDFDVFLVNEYLPKYSKVLSYRFPVLVGIVSLIWIFTKNKRIFSWALYIFFYPFILILWKVPFFLFKQESWILAFAFINSFISVVRSIKYLFISSTIFIVSTVLILSISNKILLMISIFFISLLLSMIYFNRFKLIFKPTGIFQVHISFFSVIRKYGDKLFSLDEASRNKPVQSLDDKQMEKWISNLQMSVLFNRFCLFIAKKLKDYQNSKLNFLYYVLTIFILIMFSAISFSLINYAIFKINTESFDYTKPPTFFIFFYYSFNLLVQNHISELVPSNSLSQAISMVLSFLSLIILVILISLLFSVKSERHSKELNDVILKIEKQGLEMESFIKEEYKINSVTDAINELDKMKASFIKFIFKLTEKIE